MHQKLLTLDFPSAHSLIPREEISYTSLWHLKVGINR